MRLVERTTCMCRGCGNVIIAKPSVIRDKQRKAKRDGHEFNGLFCDLECAGLFKKHHNKTKGYQDRSGITKARLDARLQVLIEWRNKQKSRLVCLGCFGLFRPQGNKRFCSSKCVYEVNKARLRNSYRQFREANPLANLRTEDTTCERCGEIYKQNPNRPSRFCSRRCSHRHYEKNRKHRLRSVYKDGDDISLDELMSRFNGQCFWCAVKCKVPDGGNENNEATIDHIIPLSKGGTHTWDNVQLLCRACNCFEKRDVTPPVQNCTA